MKNHIVDLSAAIKAQRSLVAQNSPADVPVFERVIGILPSLQSQLDLGQFLGALVIDHKPRVVYRFLNGKEASTANLGPQVVLKVYGDRPRGEGPLEQLWRARGVEVPRLEYGEVDDCSWLVMEHLELRPLPVVPISQWELADQLAHMARIMHRPAQHLEPVLRPLSDVMVPRWEDAVVALRRAGHKVPSKWISRAVAGYTSTPAVPLHGDLAPANMGKSRGGRLIIFDASALYGASCFDAARWAARVGSRGCGPEALFRRWLSMEGVLLTPEAWELFAAECVMEAGSREIVRARALRDSRRVSHWEIAAGVPELLSFAARQWS